MYEGDLVGLSIVCCAYLPLVLTSSEHCTCFDQYESYEYRDTAVWCIQNSW